MSPTWEGVAAPEPLRIDTMGWIRVAVRGVFLGCLVFGGLLLLLATRLVERPLYGSKRPATPYITRAVCRSAFVVLGMGHDIRGRPMTGQGAVVANHSSWLDIFALNAGHTVYFVSKSEVAAWPAVGWLARATGTLFIRRHRGSVAAQRDLVRHRLEAGHRLVFFPEGTSTDGKRVLAFKTSLFEAFFADHLKKAVSLQAVSVLYTAPPDVDPRFYGWWGNMDFAAHLLQVLAIRRQGKVTVIYHPAVAVADFITRKQIAQELEATVRQGLGNVTDRTITRAC